MSDRRNEHGPEPLESFFKMGRRKPTVAILVILALLAGLGLVAGAALNEQGSIPAHIPSRNTDVRVQLPPWMSSAVASTALAQPVNPTVPPVRTTGGGSVVVLGPERAVVIDVPEGWTVIAQDDAATFAFFRGPNGTSFGAELVNVDALTPASDLLIKSIDDVLATERYTQRHLSVLQTRVPFGHLVSWAVTGYSAIRTDLQGAQSVGGNLSVYVREDGLALIVNSEVSPVGAWDEQIETWEPLLLNAAESFARQPFP